MAMEKPKQYSFADVRNKKFWYNSLKKMSQTRDNKALHTQSKYNFL